MAQNLKIKKITLPSGNTYLVYDEYTRNMVTTSTYTPGVAYKTGDLIIYEDELYRVTADISAAENTQWSDVSKVKTSIDAEFNRLRSAVSGIMSYIGVGTSNVQEEGSYLPITDGSPYSTIRIDNIVWTYGDVYDADQHTFPRGSVVISGAGSQQREYVWSGTTWNEFGSTGALRAFAFADTGTANYDKTTGVTVTIPTVNPSTAHVQATASGTQIGITTTAQAITGFGTHSKTSYVESYPGTTKKLATTSINSAGAKVTIPNVTGNVETTATNTVFGTSTTASKASAGTAVNVATTDTAKTVASGSLGTETSTRTADTPMWGATVTNETLSFTFKPLSTTSVTPAKSNGTITPYTFADVTVPVVTSNDTVKSTKVTLGTSIEAAGVATSVIVATGSVATSDDNGATVMTGLGTPTTSQAITELGTATTAAAATAIGVTADPTISLSEANTVISGQTIDLVKNVSTGTTTTDAELSYTATATTVNPVTVS